MAGDLPTSNDRPLSGAPAADRPIPPFRWNGDLCHGYYLSLLRPALHCLRRAPDSRWTHRPVPQMRHALGDAGRCRGRAALAAFCRAAGRAATGGRPAGRLAMSAAETLPPAPDRAREPAGASEPARARRRAHRAGGLHWLRLVVILLILVGIVAALVKLPWSRHGAPPSAGRDSGAGSNRPGA